MKKLAQNIAKRIELNENNIREFLNETFTEVAIEYGLNGTQFQKRAKKVGDAFEACVEVIINTFYPDIALVPKVTIPQACMERGGEADFIVYRTDSTGFASRIVAVLEAKGSADHVIGKDGKRVEFHRPGMSRTDTVKKAICNAYQINRALPATLFFIVTSHKPKSGNAKCMCDLAEGDIVDKIVDATSKKELDEMVAMIRKKL